MVCAVGCRHSMLRMRQLGFGCFRHLTVSSQSLCSILLHAGSTAAAAVVAVSAVAALCGSKGSTLSRDVSVQLRSTVPQRDATPNNCAGLQSKQQGRMDSHKAGTFSRNNGILRACHKVFWFIRTSRMTIRWRQSARARPQIIDDTVNFDYCCSCRCSKREIL